MTTTQMIQAAGVLAVLLLLLLTLTVLLLRLVSLPLAAAALALDSAADYVSRPLPVAAPDPTGGDR